jgi:hypothetical protein
MNKLFDVYLQAQNVKNAIDLIHNYLLDKDLDPNDLMIESLNNFMIEPPEGADPNNLLLELEQLDIPQARPKWTAQKEYWYQMLKLANEPNALDDTGS